MPATLARRPRIARPPFRHRRATGLTAGHGGGALFLAMMFTPLGAMPADAQPGWGGAGWGGPGWGSPAPGAERWNHGAPEGGDSREGKVSAEHFIAADATALLGHGSIAVAAAPGGSADEREEATFEAAIVDQFARAGYDTATPDPHGGQVTEVTLTHDVVQPEEEKKSPVSGEMSVGVSNRGSMMSMALAVDMSKPRKALISTHLEIRIRDRATNKPLYEGRAEVVTREGDSHWTSQAIATRLVAALFEHFPHGASPSPGSASGPARAMPQAAPATNKNATGKNATGKNAAPPNSDYIPPVSDAGEGAVAAR